MVKLLRQTEDKIKIYRHKIIWNFKVSYLWPMIRKPSFQKLSSRQSQKLSSLMSRIIRYFVDYRKNFQYFESFGREHLTNSNQPRMREMGYHHFDIPDNVFINFWNLRKILIKPWFNNFSNENSSALKRFLIYLIFILRIRDSLTGFCYFLRQCLNIFNVNLSIRTIEIIIKAKFFLRNVEKSRYTSLKMKFMTRRGADSLTLNLFNPIFYSYFVFIYFFFVPTRTS